MIDVFVLFISTHGGMIPIMELPTHESCEVYQEQYARSFKQTSCLHLQRHDRHFRPKTHRKNNGSISSQSR